MAKRNTIQKQLVATAIKLLPEHVTADEVYERIIMEYPGISKGTVYRNLNSLVEEGGLVKVAVPNGADYFDYVLTPHHHIQCGCCGRLMNISQQDDLAQLGDRIEKMTGYKLESPNFIFTGICPECQKKSAAEEQK